MWKMPEEQVCLKQTAKSEKRQQILQSVGFCQFLLVSLVLLVRSVGFRRFLSVFVGIVQVDGISVRSVGLIGIVSFNIRSDG